MKAYIVHLPRSSQRGLHIAGQMASAGLDHAYVSTVDGADLTGADYESLIDPEAVRLNPNWLTPGMLGCALSHYNAYRAIVADQQEVALVLEDDAVLPADVGALLRAVEESISGKEVVLLYYRSDGTCQFSAHQAVALGDGRRLLDAVFPGRARSTAAYVITREAAISMCNFVIPIRAGPDSWGFFCEHRALERLRCVVPRPVGVRNDFKSSIDYFPGKARLQRMSSAIAEHRVFPFFQLLAAKRRLRERAMSRFEIVEAPAGIERTDDSTTARA